jgi:hypothetical protein
LCNLHYAAPVTFGDRDEDQKSHCKLYWRVFPAVGFPTGRRAQLCRNASGRATPTVLCLKAQDIQMDAPMVVSAVAVVYSQIVSPSVDE